MTGTPSSKSVASERIDYFNDLGSACEELKRIWLHELCQPAAIRRQNSGERVNQPEGESIQSSFPVRDVVSPPAKVLQPVSETGSADTPWRFGFAKAFRKSVDSIDRNLQGRILQAITELANSQTTNRGDTIKPLSGELRGFWRYRIGDYRLVFCLDENTRTITLHDFASRGSIYD